MPGLISPDLMEETWTSVAEMSAEELQRHQALCSDEQEELTGFAMTMLAEIGPDAGGVALYTHIVLMEAFRRTKATFATVEREDITKAWDANGEFVEVLQDAGYGRQPFQVDPEKQAEPAALQYAFDALTEDDDDDPVDIDDDDFWMALRVLKTIIDCMHDAQRT